MFVLLKVQYLQLSFRPAGVSLGGGGGGKAPFGPPPGYAPEMESFFSPQDRLYFHQALWPLIYFSHFPTKIFISKKLQPPPPRYSNCGPLTLILTSPSPQAEICLLILEQGRIRDFLKGILILGYDIDDILGQVENQVKFI